ncbi:MAG: PAS domain S-box protein [Bacteroidales bacterium]|nr:PAS domain S-box protein [Bacteroidales bacterium]
MPDFIHSKTNTQNEMILHKNNIDLFNEISHPVVFRDLNDTILFCNNSFQKLFEYSCEEVIGKLKFDYFVLKYFDHSFYKEGNPHQNENDFSFFATLKIARLAKIQNFILLNYRLSNENTISFLIDHSEKIEYLQKIFTQNTQIHKAFNSIPDIIFIFDEDYIVREINYKEGSYLLLPREELLNKSIDNLPLSSVLIEKTKVSLEKVFKTGESVQYEYSLGEGNDEHFFECRMISGEKQVISIIRDVTDIIQREKKVIDKKEKYRNLLEDIPQAIVEVSIDGTILYKNQQYIDFLKKASITNRENLKDILGLEVFDLLMHNFNNGIGKNIVLPFGRFFIEFRISKSNQRENSNAYLILLNDVSENELNKRALQESKDNYEILVETSPNGIIIRDFDNVYYANKKAKEIFNVKDINTLDFAEYFSPDDLIAFKGRLSAVKNGIEVAYKEFHVIHPDRSEMIIETKPVFIQYKGKAAFQIVFRDISLQKKLQEERFEKQLMFETNRNLRNEIDNRLIIEDELRNSLDQNKLLLKEIHHRIKNNFQVISSLINFTAKNYSDPLLNNSFSNINSRIKSMAIVHDFFYKSEDFSSVLISVYLRKIHSEFLRESGMNGGLDIVRFKSNVDELCVGLDDAITIGLIFSELMVVCKYVHENFTNKYCNFVELKQIDKQWLELCMNFSGQNENLKLDFNNKIDFSLLEVLIAQLNGIIEKDSGICQLRLKMELTKKL